MSADELPAEIRVRSAVEDEGDVAAGDLITRSNWQQPLLAGVFALLLVETMLAWRFSRGVA
jgi:hypothetical protein